MILFQNDTLIQNGMLQNGTLQNGKVFIVKFLKVHLHLQGMPTPIWGTAHLRGLAAPTRYCTPSVQLHNRGWATRNIYVCLQGTPTPIAGTTTHIHLRRTSSPTRYINNYIYIFLELLTNTISGSTNKRRQYLHRWWSDRFWLPFLSFIHTGGSGPEVESK